MSRLVGVVKELWAKHENLVKRHPLFFNSVYYGNMYCISDLSQQLVVTPLARGEPRQKLKPDEAFRCWVKNRLKRTNSGRWLRDCFLDGIHSISEMLPSRIVEKIWA